GRSRSRPFQGYFPTPGPGRKSQLCPECGGLLRSGPSLATLLFGGQCNKTCLCHYSLAFTLAKFSYCDQCYRHVHRCSWSIRLQLCKSTFSLSLSFSVSLSLPLPLFLYLFLPISP